MTPRLRSRTKAAAAASSLAAVAALVTPVAASATGSSAPPPIEGSHFVAHPASHGDLLAAPTVRSLLARRASQTVLLTLNQSSAVRTLGAAHMAGLSRAAAASRERQQAARVDTVERALLPKITATGARVVFRTQYVSAGIAVRATARQLRAILALPGIVRVQSMAPKRPSNAHAVYLTGGPVAWDGGDLGSGVKVAVIDTGLDYTHADFGGPHTDAAFADAASGGNNQAVATTDYPTCSLNALNTLNADIDRNKVVDGCDFVGDQYDGGFDANGNPDSAGAAAHPDANPLDCKVGRQVTGGVADGHGTHVAGTVAGYGVNHDGTTYGLTSPGGAIDPSQYTNAKAATFTSDLQIGPGVAPAAQLISLRVFGCAGATNFVSKALDWVAAYNAVAALSSGAVAPIRILNLSLGSDFAPGDDPDASALNALTANGNLLPVVAAGNAGDMYDATGAPGDASRVLTVAASDDNFEVADGLPVSPSVDGKNTLTGLFSALFDYAAHPAAVTAHVAIPSDPTACTPLPLASLTGTIALIQAADFVDASGGACGSIKKFNYVQNAGAVGAVIVADDSSGSESINGNGPANAPDGVGIPGMILPKEQGDALSTAVGGGTVTATLDYPNQHNAVSYIATADTTDTPASFTSRGGTSANGILKPDVSAPGVTIFSADAGHDSQGQTLSGTSMATPHTAGVVALVASNHPGFTPEQLKAAVMNTATSDVFDQPGHAGHIYPPTRVGVGRIHADAAAATGVLAYDSDDPGAVGVGFGPIAVTTDGQLVSKHVTVQNTTGSPVTYTPSYQPATSLDGASVTVSPTAATVVPAHGTATVTVTLSLSKDALDKVPDPTRSPVESDLFTIAEVTGRLLLTPASGPVLRVPVAAAPRPASQTQSAAPTVSLTPSGATLANGVITLTGVGVHNVAGPASVQSVVSGYQLGAQSSPLPACSAASDACVEFPSERGGDLRYVGATVSGLVPGDAGGGYLAVAISSYGPVPTPSYNLDASGLAGDIGFYVLIDTNDDGTPDFEMDASRISGTDVLVAETYSLASLQDVDLEYINGAPGSLDTDTFNTDSFALPVALSAIGSPTGDITYEVGTQSLDTAAFLDDSGPIRFNVAHPELTVGSQLLNADMPGTGLTVRRDTTDTTQASLGVLLLHHHGLDGSRAEVVAAKLAQTVTLPGVPTHKVGDAAFAVAATASSGLPVTLTGSPATVCTTSGLNVTVLSAGTCTLTATQPGNDAFAAAAPASTSFVVTGVPGVTLTPYPGPFATGQPIPVVVSIGAPNAGGTVTIRSGTTVLRTGTVAGSVALLTLPGQHAGSYALTAVYSGDASNPGATSSPVTVKVGKGKTTTVASVPASQRGHTVRVGVLVKPVSPAAGRVTGKVVIASGGRKVTVALRNGRASGTLKLGKGTHTVVVTYKGSNDFSGSSVRKKVTITG